MSVSWNGSVLNGSVPLLDQVPTRWCCPNCDLTDVTFGLHPNRYHPCPGLHGLNAPMVREGMKAKVEAAEREDYIGTEIQRQGDDGRQYMNTRLTWAAAGSTGVDEGEDLQVFAGLARLDWSSS